MKKYPSIEQFRNIVRKVRESHDYQGKDENGKPIYQHVKPYPTLTFKGTVKLHGTNAAVVKYKDGTVKYQSRERELTLQQDNAQFMLNMSNKNLDWIFDQFEFNDYIAVYGEWCGKGIQKGVAISELDRMFVIFGIKIDDEWKEFYGFSPENRIFNINQFPTYDVEINFNEPEAIQNTLIDLTLEVEKECPVGAYFGVKGVGEGIVFTSVDYPELRFKSKGEKHSISKVKVLNSINVEEIENLKEFIEYSCTENRMKQGLENISSIENKYIGDFIRWVANDILKEEQDTIINNQIDWKKASKLVANKCREFFFKQL